MSKTMQVNTMDLSLGESISDIYGAVIMTAYNDY